MSEISTMQEIEAVEAPRPTTIDDDLHRLEKSAACLRVQAAELAACLRSKLSEVLGSCRVAGAAPPQADIVEDKVEAPLIDNIDYELDELGKLLTESKQLIELIQ